MREFGFWTSVVGIICLSRLLAALVEARLEKSRCLFGCAKRNIIKVSSERGICCRCGWMQRIANDRAFDSQR
jgi:hypothetical protein